MEIKGIPVIERLANKENYGYFRNIKNIDYIVVHYTGVDGDTVPNSLNYFANNVTKTSANFFVDSKQIGICVPADYFAYHCGGGLQGTDGHTFFRRCSNYNSIGIEICDDYRNGAILPSDATLENAAALTAWCMRKYNVPIENVIRHWDVTGKICPAYFVGDNNQDWLNWKKEVYNMYKRYNKEEDLPEYAKEPIRYLTEKGYLKGSGSGWDLSPDMLRILVIMARSFMDKEKSGD